MKIMLSPKLVSNSFNSFLYQTTWKWKFTYKLKTKHTHTQ